MTFVEVVRSKYRTAVSFRHGSTQHDTFNSHRWKEEMDSLLDFEDCDDEDQSQYRLYRDNPLDFGYFLDTIISKGKCC